MTRHVLLIAVLTTLGGLAGYASVWVTSATPGPSDTTRPGRNPSTPDASVPRAQRLLAPCPEVTEQDLEQAEHERKQLEVELRMAEGARNMDFGPNLSAPSPEYEPQAARELLDGLFTVGTLRYSACESYPCSVMWDVTGADPTTASAQLAAFRERFPDATSSWWQYAGDTYVAPRNQVPIILHAPTNWDESADQNHTLPVGRVRFISRMLKAESLAGDPERASTRFEDQDSPIPFD